MLLNRRKTWWCFTGGRHWLKETLWEDFPSGKARGSHPVGMDMAMKELPIVTLEESNLIMSNEACKLNPYCGAGDET